MRRLIAVLAIAMAMTAAAACEPDDGVGGSPGVEDTGLESAPVESMAPEVSPSAS